METVSSVFLSLKFICTQNEKKEREKRTNTREYCACYMRVCVLMGDKTKSL